MKNKVKSLINNNKYILITGGASLFIILLVYFCYSIVPFGDRTIYRMDLYHQYGPLFTELYDRLVSGSSLLYSWNTGLGSSFIGNLFNYLSSPFSFIILLFGRENTFEAVAAMIAIKAVLSAVSMAYYLKKTQKKDDPAIIAFGVMYAFCAYFVAYYWNVMWIDSMYLLPFVVMGIEKIIDTGKCKTYIIALVLSIFTNYYIGFMICIFSCVYFLYYYYCSLDKIDAKHKILKAVDDKGNKISKSFFLHSGIRFALSSFSAALILLFMLIPVAYVLSSSSATSSSFPTESSSYFGIFDFLANHLASLEPTIRSSGDTVLPNVYCGTLTLILIFIYFLSKKISLKEKVASIALLAFMYFSFNINILNFIWHGLHYPNDLPYRQSFMYSFILIVMAYKAFNHILDFNKKHIISIGVILIAFIIAVQRIGSANATNVAVLLSIVFVILLTVVLCYLTSKKTLYFSFTIVLVCSVIAEVIICNTPHYVANQSKPNFVYDYEYFNSAQTYIDENDEDLFYRVELSDLRTRMDPSWYNYNGVSVFSSMAYEKVANLQKDIGLYGNKINSFTYNPNSPIYNSIFSVKYIYDKEKLISESQYYTKVHSNDIYNVYKNNYHLNIAFPVSKDVLNWNAGDYENPVTAQEEFFLSATGIDNVYNRIFDYNIDYNNIQSFNIHHRVSGALPLNKEDKDKGASITVTITAKDNGNIYAYVYSRNVDEVTVSSPVINTKMDVLDGYILDLGNYNKGDIIKIDVPLSEDKESANLQFVPFTINNMEFKEGYEILKSGQIEYTRFNDTEIIGKFTADEDEILYTSIPYDKGWKIIIDGEPVNDADIFTISDGLLGINVSEGEHTISFRYSIPYMNIACIFSLVFTFLLITLFIMKNKKIFIFKNLKPNLWERSDVELPVSETEEINSIEKTEGLQDNEQTED